MTMKEKPKEARRDTMEAKLSDLVVTTEHKGVFFGRAVYREGREITLQDAQMCVYWSGNGVLSVASEGPDANCRITKPVPSMFLPGVTAIIRATPEAAAAWRKAPWKN